MRIKHTLFRIITVVWTIALCCSCKSVRELRAMQKCDFSFVGISDFEYAGVQFNKIQSVEDIGIEDITRIIAAAASKSTNASFNINVKVVNQSNSLAAVNGMKWILYMEDDKLLEGDLSTPFSVEPQGSAVMSLRANIVPSTRGRAAPLQQIFRLYQNITGFGNGDAPNLTLKVKPTVNKIELPFFTMKITDNQISK